MDLAASNSVATGGQPQLVVLSSVFPRAAQPTLGLFVRERMFRVGRDLCLVVASPVPWFPGESLVRHFRPHFRPRTARFELQEGIQVFFPRFFSYPGLLKRFDGFFMAAGCYPLLRRLRDERRLDMIDAHFVYPEGYAAYLLGKWLGVPFTVTARGTEARHVLDPALRKRMRLALQGARHAFAVAGSLKELLVSLQVDPDKVTVIGNAVDTLVFHPVDKSAARSRLGLPQDAHLLISVGGLAERKGFHRVIECLPRLISKFPSLHYLIVGGAGPEGDWGPKLRQQVDDLRLSNHVHFLGHIRPDELKIPLSASDVFVLATRNEGWANVFLEAMACGLPVVTTDVGGNREVVREPDVGIVVPFGDPEKLTCAVEEALTRAWNRESIVHYASDNDWPSRTNVLVEKIREAFMDGSGVEIVG